MGNYTFFAERPSDSFKKSDNRFSIMVILLLGIGLFTLYFCSQAAASRMFNDSFYFVKRQLICSLVGLGGFLLFAFLPIETVRKMIPGILLGTVIICLLTFIPAFSVERNGARRWLKMPFNFTLQSSEVVKFTLILFLANFFDKQASISDPEERNVFAGVCVMLFLIALVLKQKDLSTSIFLFGFGCLFFAACGMKIKWMWFVGFLVILCFIYYIVSQEYRIERIIAFMNPGERQTSSNFQSLAAKRAISAGGFWGAGIGSNLVQSGRIPEVQADFIFASWAEANGFGGVICYFIMLGIFGWRGIKIAMDCKDRFASFASYGFVSLIVLQSLLNCAVVCGALPSTGIPLPFFSLGGSSIIITLCMSGFVVNASRCNSENENVKNVDIDINEVDTIGGVKVYE